MVQSRNLPAVVRVVGMKVMLAVCMRLELAHLRMSARLVRRQRGHYVSLRILGMMEAGEEWRFGLERRQSRSAQPLVSHQLP